MDFPITGGGLTAFPGLYSYYMLGIPFLNVLNSHNLFLDVTIEQGLPGGLVFLTIYLLSIWETAAALARARSSRANTFARLVLFGLIVACVHGLVDDYLYNGHGTALCLALPGLAAALQPERRTNPSRVDRYRTSVMIVAGLAGVSMMSLLGARATWYSNLGAVQMAKVVLVGFPTDQWTDIATLPALAPAEDSFYSALQMDAADRTANQRLGLIFLLRRDFSAAAQHLELALREAPGHRGIIKALGYSYVWLGEIDKGVLLLSEIPEAREELDVYQWWWRTDGRNDLSEKAGLAHQQLDLHLVEPGQ
jgi:tetratricopeptide (TPR) repeat protein